jgi:hypothetical protein
MVIQTEEGWLGADGQYYTCSSGAHESFARKFGWPKPEISKRDRINERRLRVFLSHAKEDQPVVRELHDRLMRSNVDPWLDAVNILPGQKWRTAISKAIRATDAFVACLSPVAVSKVGYINHEFKEGLEIADQQPEGKVFVIPLKLQQCDVPERFRDTQWADYFHAEGFPLLLQSLIALAEWLREHGSKVSLPA